MYWRHVITNINQDTGSMIRNSFIHFTTVFIVLIILMPLSFSCSNRDVRSLKTSGSIPLDSINTECINMARNGLYDSVIQLCRPFYKKAASLNDTLSTLLLGLTLAQMYLVKDMPDSVDSYFTELSEYKKAATISGFYNHLQGVYALRYELDYEKALDYHLKACEQAEISKDWNNVVSELLNIVNIFYAQSDGFGLEYALKTVAIANAHSGAVSEYHRTSMNYLLASMLLLNGKDEEALELINGIHDNGQSFNIEFIINLIKGDIYNHMHNDSLTEKYYTEALKYVDNNSSESKSLIYLKYGQFLQTKGRYQQAVSMYRNGIDFCTVNKDILYLKDLYLELANSYNDMGEKDSSIYYYMVYYKFLDSLNISSTERKFNQRIRYYQKLEHDLESESYKKKLAVYLAIIAIFILTVIFITIFFFHQRRTYKLLVIQHQRWLQQYKIITEEKENSITDADKSDMTLFLKIEELMKTDKLYRTKNLTLDKIAEEVGTNRSYVSRAINQCAKMKFSNYIDNYRITEATSMISGDMDNLSFKQLADYLGYNSVSVFYRSFQREIGCPPGRYKKEALHLNGNKIIDEV